MATAAIIPAETVTLIAEALSDAERELEWFTNTYGRYKSTREAIAKVRAAKAAFQAITDGR